MIDTILKPVSSGKLWIVEHAGTKIGTVTKQPNDSFLISGINGTKILDRDELTIEFGDDIFKPESPQDVEIANECYGYPTMSRPFNPVFDIRRKLPLFTKSRKSKGLFCAGYYLIEFNKGIVKAFCPKVSTIDSYSYKGPFKTECDVKAVMQHTRSTPVYVELWEEEDDE